MRLKPPTVVFPAMVLVFGLGAGDVFGAGGVAGGSASASINATPSILDPVHGVGSWIWDSKAYPKQTCRFWRAIDVPNSTVAKAWLRLTVDNGYRLFLDGREIGRGSDWRTITELDLTWLLNHGRHVLAVEAFNDRLEGGLIMGLRIELVDQRVIEVASDESWWVVPESEKRWEGKTQPGAGWQPATIVGSLGTPPWTPWPLGTVSLPTLQPVTLRFWQTGWFQVAILSVCGLAVLISFQLMTRLAVQSKAQQFLQLERARIARDIHDDLGSRLTQLVLLGEVARSELPAGSEVRTQMDHICDKARDLSHAMDEVIWAVNSRRDTLRDFVSYVCKYAQLFLAPTSIRCRLDVEPEIPAAGFDLPVRRNLFLAVKEALNNAAKHSGARELFLRIYRRGHALSVVVEDDGKGFEPTEATFERNGLTNMSQRMSEVGGACGVASAPGGGCRVEFTVPLKRPSLFAKFFRRRIPETPPADADPRTISPASAPDSTQTQVQ